MANEGRCHYSTICFIYWPVFLTVRQEYYDQTQMLGGIGKGSLHREAHPIAIQAAGKPPGLIFRIGFVRQPAGYLFVRLEPGPLYEPKQLVCIGWGDLDQAPSLQQPGLRASSSQFPYPPETNSDMSH